MLCGGGAASVAGMFFAVACPFVPIFAEASGHCVVRHVIALSLTVSAGVAACWAAGKP